jgi:hypothetical protein
MITSKYFPESDFNNCTPYCSLQNMKQTAMNGFDSAREIAGIPFDPVSAYRPEHWEKEHGRSGKGAHTEGEAIDIKCTDSRSRFIIVSALIQAGCKRIGIAKTYIHADFSITHDELVIWLYN